MIQRKPRPVGDFLSMTKHAAKWWHLGFMDIRLKYKRSFLGPIWLVVGIGTTIIMLSILWSEFLGQDWQFTVFHMAIGLVFWNYMSSFILNSSDLYTKEFYVLVRSEPVPPLFHLLRFSASQLVMLVHYFIILLVVAVISGTIPGPVDLVYFFLGLSVLVFNLTCWGLINAFLCARMRDVGPLIGTMVGPLMLLSPVIWSVDMLDDRQVYALINPITHYLDLVRKPLMKQAPTALTLAVVGGLTVLSAGIAMWTYRRFRDRLVFWL